MHPPTPLRLARSWLAWLAGSALLAALPACNEHSFVPADDIPDVPDEWFTVNISGNDDLDILFVVDNSGSMGEEQATLATNLAAFTEILERPEVAKNYRIGITTTDDGHPWCGTTGPESGALQLRSCRSHLDDFVYDGAESIDMSEAACTALCPEAWAEIETLPTTTLHDDTPRARNWIESLAGVTNLPEGLSPAQALQCLAPQGIAGCGFESPLESMYQALRHTQDADGPDFDFIRELAVLMVVIVTDEEDCSYNREWESIFLPEGNRVFWSNEDDTSPTSAVCWNAGVACTGSGTYDECHAVDLDVNGNSVAEDDAEELAVLHPMSRYVEQLQELEEHKRSSWPSQEILVSVVGGVGSNGDVTYQDADDPEFQRIFGIGPGCESESGRAVPLVRLRELAEAFAVGDGPSMASICQGDYTSVFEPVAETLVERVQPACMPTCVDDTDTSTVELDPSCMLRQEAPFGSVQWEVPRCEVGGALPEGSDVCYEPLVGEALDDYCADMGFNLQFEIVRREGIYVPPGTEIQARCERSEDPEGDCPDLL